MRFSLKHHSLRPQAARAICAANCSAFTLIELLGVLMILSILITMLVSVVGLVHRTAQRHRAETDVNALVQAVLHYRQVYGTWPCEQYRTNGSFFLAGVGESNIALFSSGVALPFSLSAADVDQSDVMAALAPDSAGNPRRIQFLTMATNALQYGRLADPWGHPYLLFMDADHAIFEFGDIAFSNLPAFAISAGIPVAHPSISNWIFSAGVRP